MWKLLSAVRFKYDIFFCCPSALFRVNIEDLIPPEESLDLASPSSLPSKQRQDATTTEGGKKKKKKKAKRNGNRTNIDSSATATTITSTTEKQQQQQQQQPTPKPLEIFPERSSSILSIDDDTEIEVMSEEEREEIEEKEEKVEGESEEGQNGIAFEAGMEEKHSEEQPKKKQEAQLEELLEVPEEGDTNARDEEEEKSELKEEYYRDFINENIVKKIDDLRDLLNHLQVDQSAPSSEALSDSSIITPKRWNRIVRENRRLEEENKRLNVENYELLLRVKRLEQDKEISGARIEKLQEDFDRVTKDNERMWATINSYLRKKK